MTLAPVPQLPVEIATLLASGTVIPPHPFALNEDRQLDEHPRYPRLTDDAFIEENRDEWLS